MQSLKLKTIDTNFQLDDQLHQIGGNTKTQYFYTLVKVKKNGLSKKMYLDN